MPPSPVIAWVITLGPLDIALASLARSSSRPTNSPVVPAPERSFIRLSGALTSCGAGGGGCWIMVLAAYGPVEMMPSLCSTCSQGCTAGLLLADDVGGV